MKPKIPYIILLVLIVTTTIVSAMPFNMQYITSTSQYYNVFFDEEGEAYVALRLDIYNKDRQPIEYLNLEIPGDGMIIYKIVQEKQYQYEEINANPARLSDSVYFTLDLEPIEKDEHSTILIFYKAKGYVDKSFGKYKFEFETIKTPYLANDVKVSIDVQEGLQLKGKRAEVNYVPDFQMFARAGALEADSYKSISNSVVRDTSYTKTAKFLDPYESFSVNGVYAENWFMMNLGWIIAIGVILFLFLILLLFVLLIKLILK